MRLQPSGSIVQLGAFDVSFYSAVWNEPDDGDEHIQPARDPGRQVREGARDRIADHRDLRLPVATDRGGKHGVWTLEAQDAGLEDVVGEARHQEHDAIDGHRRSIEMTLPCPTGCE